MGEEKKNSLEDLEADPPKNLEDWPSDERKYETFGGAEGQHSYEEGPESNLGPSEVRHHEDGSISVAGEKVDNPDEYRGEPIPGGPTDPEAPKGPTELRQKEASERKSEADSEN